MDHMQTWQAVDLMTDLYPSEPRAIAELVTALGDRQVVSFGIPVQCWSGEGKMPDLLEMGFAPVRLGSIFWGEIPVSEGKVGKHLSVANGDFSYCRWGANEFGYQWTLREAGRPDFTCREEYEFVGISRYTLERFIDERRLILARREKASAVEIRAFIVSWKGANVNEAHEAFDREFGHRARGLRDSFRLLWQELRGSPKRGRPKKLPAA